MNYEEELEESFEVEEAKARLSEIIEDASAELAELEELTDGLEELSEEDEEDVEGAGSIGLSWKPSWKNVSGSTRGQVLSECIQSFTMKCGKVTSVSVKSRSKSGLNIVKKGNYLYATRQNFQQTGTVKADVKGNVNHAHVTWTFK